MGRSSAAWKAFSAWVAQINNLLIILLLFVLDVRDLYYKVVWLGPIESFPFVTGSTSILRPPPLAIAPDRDIRNASHGQTAFDSGWPSFLASCDRLHALGADGSPFFLSAVGLNCSVGSPPHVVSELVVTSDQRADAVAWASCMLLHVPRRPAICHERIVVNFLERYAFQDVEVALADLAPAGSPAEAELLAVLDLLGASVPLHQVTCVEAFKLPPLAARSPTTQFQPQLFGCASANEFRSAFVGLRNPAIVRLLLRKAWLTADVFAVLGARYLIRQNCYTDYVATGSVAGGDLVVRSFTTTNFSSFGLLYALLLAIDVTLLSLNCLSSIELLRWMSFPKYKDVKSLIERKEATQRLSDSPSPRVAPAEALALARPQLSRSHGRQRLQRLLAASLEAISGPNAIEEEQLYSFFSRSLYRNPRIVLVTLSTQLLSWLIVMPNAVVWTWGDSLSDKAQAYLSSIRCWVLILLATNALWDGVVQLSERAAYAVTRRTYLTSVDILVVAASVSYWQRDAIFSMSERKWRLERQRVGDASSFLGGVYAHSNAFHLPLDAVALTPWAVVRILYGPLLRIVLLSLAVLLAVLLAKALYYARQQPQDSALRRALAEPYARLALETWLDTPIRASSLVRNALRMETLRDGARFIRPSCYLDYGIIVKRGVIHSRIGFAETWKPKMTVEEYMDRVEHRGDGAESAAAAANPAADADADATESAALQLFDGQDAQTMLALHRRVASHDRHRAKSLHVPLA
ncbi:hypothetical protein P43SY_005004 [Pythium insidiosum]|uniref:Transmembrane protein n=1 Tax=Pythium insidiosum TaxID=114742 RepID=A0AAD5LNT7_PYTIN|nr:hypothetical protein P43SY_005004 [Pythium insidiosum]